MEASFHLHKLAWSSICMISKPAMCVTDAPRSRSNCHSSQQPVSLHIARCHLQGLAMEVSEEGLTPEQKQTLKAIRQRKTEVVAVHRSKKAVANNQAPLPRGADRDRKSNTTNMRVRSHLDLRVQSVPAVAAESPAACCKLSSRTVCYALRAKQQWQHLSC